MEDTNIMSARNAYQEFSDFFGDNLTMMYDLYILLFCI